MVDLVSTDTQLCNMALGHIAANPIAMLSENSREAEQCRMFYGTALSYVLGDHDWKFASRKKACAQIVVPSVSPEILEADLDGWGYLYEYPSDCARVREVLTANQFQNADPFGFGNPVGAAYGPSDTGSIFHRAASNSYTLSSERGFGDQSGPEIPFNVSAIGDTRYIFCDLPSARFRYTRFMQNVIGYPADFSLVFSYYLASLLAYPLTRKFEVVGNMLKMYQDLKPQVQANNMNEATQITREGVPAHIRARGGD